MWVYTIKLIKLKLLYKYCIYNLIKLKLLYSTVYIGLIIFQISSH